MFDNIVPVNRLKMEDISSALTARPELLDWQAKNSAAIEQMLAALREHYQTADARADIAGTPGGVPGITDLVTKNPLSAVGAARLATRNPASAIGFAKLALKNPVSGVSLARKAAKAVKKNPMFAISPALGLMGLFKKKKKS